MSEQEFIRMNLPKRFWKARYDIMEEENQHIVEKYVTKAFPEYKGKGLLLWGKPGRGKTYIACLIAKLLRTKEYMVYFLPAEDITQYGLKKEFDSRSVSDRIKDVDLLVIDDLSFSCDMARLYSILKYRTENLLSTIITMRADPEELPVIAKEDGDERSFEEYFKKYFAELMPVINGVILPIQIDGPNYRKQQQEEYLNLMNED